MDTATERKTCAELIGKQMAEREAEFKALQENPESDYQDDPALSVDTEQITTVTLSWGGPADYLEIIHSGSELSRVTYRYSDWFDTATRNVEEGSALWDYAQLIADGAN